MRQLWRMAHGRVQNEWTQIASLIRAIWTSSFAAKEPPLNAFIPSAYLPRGQRELTEEEERVAKEKALLDMKIMLGLAGKGVTVNRGTTGQQREGR